MSSTKRTALNGGAIEDGVCGENRTDQIPQANHTTPAGMVSMRSLGGAGDGDVIQGEELAGAAIERGDSHG